MAADWKYRNHPADRSLKEDLSIDTTFDPSYISWDTPLKKQYQKSFISAVAISPPIQFYISMTFFLIWRDFFHYQLTFYAFFEEESHVTCDMWLFVIGSCSFKQWMQAPVF